ncbi:MAG: NAD-dependent epimerase/dehydratase family protein [Pseudoxanthomonas sp.]
MPEALVLGGSGQIGVPVLVRLRARGWHVHAVSRQVREDCDGITWLRGELAAMPQLPVRVDAIFSLGPLDHFAHWYAASCMETPRIVAFGSTSVETKRDSGDGCERDLACRLDVAERGLFDAAAAHGVQATVLRPTLIYGGGGDRTLTRIAQLAKRTGFFVLPRHADGLRQPVHVEDLAAAAMAVLQAPATFGQAYALPGGETLAYRDMVARTLAALMPSPKLWEVPAPLFSLALAAARAAGRLQGFGDAAVARMREDLVFDAQPAQRDFDYAPRAFMPTRQMFGL